MNTKLTGDLCNGLATITITGTASPLSVGSIATHTPFTALQGFERGMGIPVSNEKLDGIIRRQDNDFKISNGYKYAKNPTQFLMNSSTLIKSVSPDMLYIDVTSRSIETVTGKKSTFTKVDGKMKTVKPKLTIEETILCVLYEYAHDCFRSEVGFEINVAFVSGHILTFKN